MRTRIIPTLFVAALAPLAIAAGGCGGDDNEGTTAGTPPSAGNGGGKPATGGGAAPSQVNVSETDYKLDPADPTVKAGTVTFNVTNDGQVTHSLEVEGPGEESELDQDLAPGQSGTLKVDLSNPGTYEWYCPVDDHKGLGMKGEITVSGGGGGSSSSGSSSGSSGSGGSAY